MPKMMDEAEITEVVKGIVSELGVSGIAAMGKVMGAVKTKLAGKAEMSKVSAVVKKVLLG